MTPHEKLKQTIAIPPTKLSATASAISRQNDTILRVADGATFRTRRHEDWVALVELVAGRGQ